MIVSASKERADANSIFIKRIIDLMPQLQELKPKQGQRDAVISFDVGPAKPDHSPSVKSVGITGQLTGSRADILIADDVEVPNNSATQAARDRLSELVKEFDAILKPGGTIIYLGTPQNEMTLYRELEGRGYTTTIWPARYPRDRKDWQSYGDRLAPMLQAELEEDPESFYLRPTDEVRFDDTDLKERELSYGKAGFALQFMLNPNLSDAEKYPLKLRDLIVADLDPASSPMVYQWLPNPQNKREDVPNVGLMGDSYHTYQTVGSAFSSYTQKILVIDLVVVVRMKLAMRYCTSSMATSSLWKSVVCVVVMRTLRWKHWLRLVVSGRSTNTSLRVTSVMVCTLSYSSL